MIEVIEHYGGNIGDDKASVVEELKYIGNTLQTADSSEMLSATEIAR